MPERELQEAGATRDDGRRGRDSQAYRLISTRVPVRSGSVRKTVRKIVEVCPCPIKLTDIGGDGRPIETGPIIARTVWVRAEVDWHVDMLQSLLPSALSFVRIDATNCAIGSSDSLMP